MRKTVTIALSALVLAAVAIACASRPRVAVEPPPEWQGGLPSWTEWPEGHRKRGVAYNFNTPANDGDITRADVELLAPGVRWFYNWSPRINYPHVDEAIRGHNLTFIPQIWNDDWDFDTVLADLRVILAEHPGIQWIMAYNEPNLVDQANLTPEQAARDWPRFVRLARELDLKIISPAMNFGTMPGFGDPLVWLTEFFAHPNVDIDDIHAIRIHTYMSHGGALKWYVEQFKRWGLPIWVTEFCAWYYATSEEFQMNFMSEALTYLELNPWVEKYFWFIPKGGWAGTHNENHPFHHLLTVTNPPQLTPLGVVYVNMPTFDRSVWVPAGQRMNAGHITNVNMSERLLVPGYFDRSVFFRPSTDTAADREILDIHGFIGNLWVEYQAEVPTARAYTLSIRNIAPSPTVIDIYVNGELAQTATLSQTTEWRTTSVPLDLAAGRHTIRLFVRSGNCAINWLILE